MLKKATAVTAILSVSVILGTPTLPFLSLLPDAEPCCPIPVENSCCQDTQLLDCEYSFSECKPAVFLPLVSAPLKKVDPRPNYGVLYAGIQVIPVLALEHSYRVPDPAHLPQPPPAFLTPLLI